MEGYWNTKEAEGGAKMLVGPSVHYQPPATPFNFTVSGGPAFYLTKNKAIGKAEAVRKLENDVQNGYSFRLNVNYGF